jgi:hypothetical protein
MPTTIDDLDKLADEFRNGNRFLVISKAKDGRVLMSMVDSRERASALVNNSGTQNQPAIAFAIRDLCAGSYAKEQPPAGDAAYRKVGVPEPDNYMRLGAKHMGSSTQ